MTQACGIQSATSAQKGVMRSVSGSQSQAPHCASIPKKGIQLRRRHVFCLVSKDVEKASPRRPALAPAWPRTRTLFESRPATSRHTTTSRNHRHVRSLCAARSCLHFQGPDSRIMVPTLRSASNSPQGRKASNTNTTGSFPKSA